MTGILRLEHTAGFTLVEVSIALFLLAFGLLTAGQVLFVATASNSLARSKGTAAVAAQSRMEYLESVYHDDPSSPDLTPGDHGPVEVRIANPEQRSTLNLYSVTWTVSAVQDPRPGKTLKSRAVIVTATPALPGGSANYKPALNKVVKLATVFSPVLR